SRKGTRLGAGILNAGTFDLQFLRTKNPFQPNVMTVLLDRPDADQPYLHARKKGSKELVYIGENDTSQRLPIGNGKTATVDQSRDAGKTHPVFSSPRVEKRTTLGQNGPQTRPISHADGTVYAAFYRWRAASGNFQANTLMITSADVVVVRDDNFGS